MDTADLHILWRETNRYIDSLTQAVREAKRVDEASHFGRWLRFSGVLKLLEKNPAGMPLPVDGKALIKKTDDLIYACGELYRGGKHDPRYSESDIAEINRKLDILAAHIGRARTFAPSTTQTANAVEAASCVLTEGAPSLMESAEAGPCPS